MKKVFLALALIGMMFASNARASITYSGTIVLKDDKSGDGASYTAYTTAYGTSSLSGTTFGTFCIEKNEYFDYNTTYYYNINSYATMGGVSGATGGKDYLSMGTAWLYYQFRSGTLSSFVSGPVSKSLLQNAFWMLEGELRYGQTGYSMDNKYILAVEKALNTYNLTTIQNMNANGAYGVVVLNLYDRWGGYHQDQLGLVSQHTTAVPEPSTIISGALLVLPFGFGIYRSVRRKIKS